MGYFVAPDHQVAGARRHRHRLARQVDGARIGPVERTEPALRKAMVEPRHDLERALIGGCIGQIEDRLRLERDRRRQVAVPMQMRAGKPVIGPLGRIETQAVGRDDQVGMAVQLGKCLRHAQRPARHVHRRMLEMLDHDAVGARPVPAGGIAGIGPDQRPEVIGDRRRFVARNRLAQHDHAVAVPLRQLGIVEHARRRHHFRLARRLPGGRRGAFVPGVIARDPCGVGWPGGGRDPAGEVCPLGPLAPQHRHRLLEPEAERVEQGANRHRLRIFGGFMPRHRRP